jgi:hypothetical protein
MNKTLSTITQFSCLGSHCPDSCCHSWTVPLEEKSTRFLFQATQKNILNGLSFDEVVHLEGKQMVQAYLKRDEESNSCILLESDGLCTVHKNHGHEHLSQACAVYPRNLLVFGTHTEETAHLSCPEIARLFLTSSTLPVFLKNDIKPIYQPNFQIKDQNSYTRHAFSIRDVFFRLIQHEQRVGLYRVVHFCAQSTKTFHNEISRFSQQSLRSLHKRSMRSSPSPLSIEEEEQLHMLSHLTLDFLNSSRFHSSLKNYLCEELHPQSSLWNTIHSICTSSDPIIVQWFVRVLYHFLYTTSYTQYTNLHEYIHVLVIRLWVLVIVYAHRLGTISDSNNNIDWDEVVTCTAKVMKVLEHNPSIVTQLQHQIPLSQSILLSRMFSSFLVPSCIE